MSKKILVSINPDNKPFCKEGFTIGKIYDVLPQGEYAYLGFTDDDGWEGRVARMFIWEDVVLGKSDNLVENSTAELCKNTVDVDKEWADYSGDKCAMKEDGYTIKISDGTSFAEAVATKAPKMVDLEDIPVAEGCEANISLPTMRLSNDSDERKNMPIFSGVLNYFPLALAEIAKLSKLGNDKHNPGQPLHWAKEKSTDHKDCIARHLIDAGTIDPDSEMLHDVGLAWRALANLETVLEKLND
jgi:hypothetical protein